MDFTQQPSTKISIPQVKGEPPINLYGHTANLISKHKLLIFGGARGSPGSFIMSNTSYLVEIEGNPTQVSWWRLEGTLILATSHRF